MPEMMKQPSSFFFICSDSCMLLSRNSSHKIIYYTTKAAMLRVTSELCLSVTVAVNYTSTTTLYTRNVNMIHLIQQGTDIQAQISILAGGASRGQMNSRVFGLRPLWCSQPWIGAAAGLSWFSAMVPSAKSFNLHGPRREGGSRGEWKYELLVVCNCACSVYCGPDAAHSAGKTTDED